MAVLAEAGHFSRSLAAPLCLIHADEFTKEKEERFRSALRDLQLDSGAAIRFQPGEPAQAILKIQREESIDLLIAGAMETQSVHRNFTGDVARELLRRAPCDLLLYTEPKEDPKPPGAMLVVVPDLSESSRRVVGAALNLAGRSGGRHITILHVQTTFAEAKEKALGVSNGSLSAEQTLKSWIEGQERPNLELDYHLLRGNTGFTACEFIQSSGTDLVVMPSQMPPSDQPVFAPALDWIIQVIPGNLWVIRQTENQSILLENLP
ncbi:MAG: universal stress protein [Verrucomicrobia bacterium]|nr:universal stress protein [Verrucomicrobiota bacterium]